MKMTTTTEVDISLDLIAQCFTHLTDDEQAQFFVKVAEYAERDYPASPEQQWWYVGRHLRTCECSTEAARDLLRAIVAAMDCPPAPAATDAGARTAPALPTGAQPQAQLESSAATRSS